MSAPPVTDPSQATSNAAPRATWSAPTSATKETEPSQGLFHHFGKWCEALAHYFQLRIQLALLEAKEAGSHYAWIAGLFAGAAFLALMGYLLLVLTAVFALAAWMEGPHIWLKILGGATALHLVLAVVLVLLAKARLKAGMFEKTKAEFRKDQPWRKTPITKH